VWIKTLAELDCPEYWKSGVMITIKSATVWRRLHLGDRIPSSEGKP